MASLISRRTLPRVNLVGNSAVQAPAREMSMSVAIVPTARPGKTGKIVAARKAARMIRTGDTVAIGGFFGLAMEVIHALAAIYDESDTEAASFGKPRDLTLVWCVSPGEGQQRGAQRLAQSGLIKRLIGG